MIFFALLAIIGIPLTYRSYKNDRASGSDFWVPTILIWLLAIVSTVFIALVLGDLFAGNGRPETYETPISGGEVYIDGEGEIYFALAPKDSDERIEFEDAAGTYKLEFDEDLETPYAEVTKYHVTFKWLGWTMHPSDYILYLNSEADVKHYEGEPDGND